MASTIGTVKTYNKEASTNHLWLIQQNTYLIFKIHVLNLPWSHSSKISQYGWFANCVSNRGGGGVFRGVHTLVIKIPLKHWFQVKKATLFFKKRWLLPVNKHPFFYQSTDIGWTGTRILTFDVIILCLFSGSRLGSPVTRRQSRVYFVHCKAFFTPHTSFLGTKKYPSFTKSPTCGGLKKKFIREIRSAGAAPSVPQCPSRGFQL